MPRKYSRIQQYEKEILRLKEDGYTKREIGENLGFSYEQMDDCLKNGRDVPRKESSVQSLLPL